MRRPSLKIRITAWFALMMFVIEALVLAFLLAVNGTVATNDPEARLVRMVEHNANRVKYNNRQFRFSRIHYNRSGVYTVLYDADGNVLQGTFPAEFTPAQPLPLDGESVRLVDCGDNAYYVYDVHVDMMVGSVWLRGVIDADANGGVMRVILPLAWSLLPVLLGAMLHLVLCKTDYNSVDGIAKLLWQSGLSMESGGVLSATLAIMLVKLVKKTLAMILLAVLLVTCLMLAFRLTPAAVLEAVRSHERVPYEPEEEELPPQRPARAPRRNAGVSDASIDIPLDGEERVVRKNPSGGFFRKKSDNIKSPDELLADRNAAEEKPAAPAPAKPVTVTADDFDLPPFDLPQGTPVSTPAPAPAPIPPAPFAVPALTAQSAPIAAAAAASAVLTDKQEDRLRRAEVDAAREEVTREIETGDKPEPPAYEYPPITLLKEGSVTNAAEAGAELRNNSRRLAQTLTSFGVDAQPGDVVRGPSVTRYEFTLSQGVKLSKITNLQDDIALALGASGVRIAPIPNKISVVGVEVPNKLVSPVNIRTVLESREFTQHPSTTAFAASA